MIQANISDLDFIHAIPFTRVHVSGGSSPSISTSYSVDHDAGYTIEGPYFGYSINRQNGTVSAYAGVGYLAGVSGAVSGAVAVGGTTFTYANATVIIS